MLASRASERTNIDLRAPSEDATEDLETAFSSSSFTPDSDDGLWDMQLPHDFDQDIETLPALKRTWRGAFVDIVIERAYRYDVFLPNLGSSMSRVFYVTAIFNALTFIPLTFDTSFADPTWATGWVANLVIMSTLIGFGQCFRSKTFCHVPMRLMEPVATALLIVLALFLRWHQLLVPSVACASNSTLMLRLGAFMVFVSAFVNLTVPAFLTVAVVSVSLAAALDMSFPDAAGWCPLNLANLCLLAVGATVCRYHLADSSRAAWAFKRSVITAQHARKTTLVEFERARAERYREQRREREMAKKVELAEEGKAARSRLIRTVMHDLRSPLLSILNVTKMLIGLDSATTLAEKNVSEGIDALCACTTLMECIVSDMLDFERIDSGRLVLMHRPFTLAKLLGDTYATFDGLAREKGIRLIHAELDEQLAHTEYMGDKWRLQQCLNNGVSNALKFTDRGGHVQFRVWLAEENVPTHVGLSRIHIAIADSGIGLSASELKAINSGKVFTQVGRGQLQGKGGTGLGISITQSILAMHNDSELVVKSDGEGQGTSFEITLYLEVAEPDKVPTQNAVVAESADKSLLQHEMRREVSRASPSTIRMHFKAAASEQADVGQLLALPDEETAELTPAALGLHPSPSAELELPPSFCCLHVEDDTFLQMTMPHATFIRADCRWETADNGVVALEMVANRQNAGLPPYEIIVMDNQMPRMNGCATVRELRARGYTGIIIGMTGDPIGSPERGEFEAAGLSACVEKDTSGTDYIVQVIRSFRRPPKSCISFGGAAG